MNSAARFPSILPVRGNLIRTICDTDNLQAYAPEGFFIDPISLSGEVRPFNMPLRPSAAGLLYLTATTTQHRSILKRLRPFPLLVIVGFGLSLSTTIAVLEGLFSTGGAFIRTPKLNLSNKRKGQRKVDRAYVAPLSSMVWIEIMLGIYALVTGLILAPYIGWGIVPWMVIYMLGFFYIAGLNLIQHSVEAN